MNITDTFLAILVVISALFIYLLLDGIITLPLF